MDRQQLLAQRKNLMARADLIVSGAKSAGRDLTAAESNDINRLLGKVDELDRQLDAKADPLRDRLANAGTIIVGGEEKGESWAHQVAAALAKAAESQGQKAILPAGGVTIPSPFEVVALNQRPNRLLDLIAKEEMEQPFYSYLRQTSFTNAAAVVPELQTKPMSDATFEQVDGKPVVIATMSPELPESYLRDYEAVVSVLTQQLEWGVMDKAEELVLRGNGAGDPKGILNVTGTLAVPYTTDVLTTLRAARNRLETEGVRATALAIHPDDAMSVDLTRETSTGGQFLMDAGGYERILGAGVVVVPSPRLTKGQAILADWSTVQLLVRDPLASVAFNQNRDLAERNGFQIRTEIRAGVKITRPGSIAIVDLTA